MAVERDLCLVLGGARSGKSAYAERWLAERAQGLERIYVATAEARDDEMSARIAHHRAQRGDGWRTIEEPLDLPKVVDAVDWTGGAAVLVDCLTLWLTNLLLAERSPDADIESLMASLRRSGGPLCLVSNEVGLGIVPENALARSFRDWQGRLNQIVAAEADGVVFMAAGLPMWLKGGGSDSGA